MMRVINEPFTLSVNMTNVVMLSVIMLNPFIRSVIILNGFMLSISYAACRVC
jgi:hypothetical protein